MKKQTILIVDDNPNIRGLLSTVLINYNLILSESPDLFFANEINFIDLAIIDLHYDNSKYTGIDLIKQLNKKNIKTVAITGDYIENEDEIETIGSNVAGIIEKPFDLSIIKKTILSYL